MRQAIALFDAQGNFRAVAAVQGTLGDICFASSDFARTHELYEQGLSYWQAQKHPRWIEKFKKRLQD